MIDYQIDTVPMRDAQGRWDTLGTSLVSAPLAVQSSGVAIPGMDGELATDRVDSIGAPQLVLRLKVQGTDDEEMWLNLAVLAALLRTGSTVARVIGDTTLSQPYSLLSLSDPTYLAGSAVLLITAVLKLPATYWRAASADWSQLPVVSGTSYRVVSLDGVTAPIADALLLWTGPVANPRVTDETSGAWAQLNVTLAAGEKALVDCAAWSARRGSGVTFAGGGSDTSGSIQTSGGPYLLRLTSAPFQGDPFDRRVTVRTGGSSFTSATALSIRARPAHIA